MIGSTRHSYKSANRGKIQILTAAIEEYSRVALLAFNEIWNNGYKTFSIKAENLELQSFLDYKYFNIKTTLSARALQCAVNQAGAIVRSVIEKQRRRFWIEENKNVKLEKLTFTKPKIEFVSPELNSLCVGLKIEKNSIGVGFVSVNFGKNFGKINLPINDSSQWRKWKERGARLCTFIKLFKNRFQLSWDWKRHPFSQGDKIIGADQGFSDVLTLSDGQTTPKTCPHGHSLKSICESLSRKTKDSKGFKREQAHRKNFVNYSINQLNLSNIKEFRLEKVVNIRFGSGSSQLMSHWSNPLIRDKIKRRCEELEVPVVEQSCAYRSQRCNSCGNVRKANRNGKFYCCKNCGYENDSDLNAARNHEVDLPPITYRLLPPKANLGNGFFWKPEGIFTFEGSEFIVPNNKKE